MGPCLCFKSQRGEDPPLSDQSVGQEEQRDPYQAANDAYSHY